MRVLKLAIPAAIVMAGFLVCTSTSFGKMEYAKKENKKCVDCHSKTGDKDTMAKSLTDMGKYYKEHNHSLDGYKK
jgi:hypothetical protein